MISGRAKKLGFQAASTIAQHTPRRVADSAAEFAGLVMSATMRDRRAMAARHMQRATGIAADSREVQQATRGVFDYYAKYWLGVLRVTKDIGECIEDLVTIEGYEHLEASRELGKGTILALPHLGAWEFGAAILAAKGERLSAVVERLEPAEVFDWFVSTREALGVEIIPMDAGAARRCTASLVDGRVLALMSDRDLTGTGPEVTFFSEKTTLPAGPAVLSLRLGSPILPAAVYMRPNGRCHAVIKPPLSIEETGDFRTDVALLTQEVANALEALIKVSPEQWHLLQPNWPSDRANDPLPEISAS